jgi:glycosyltransferase involved in cell wall biosynthesis
VVRQSSDRIIFDVSTSMRWTGPPVGIVRVERQLALWALANLSNVKFVFFDPHQSAYCELKADVFPFLVGQTTLGILTLPDPTGLRGRKTDRGPAALRPLILWFGQSRRMALGRLEAIRLGRAPSRLRWFAEWLQNRLMTEKYRGAMVAPDGTRRPLIPYQTILGARLEFRASDTLICAGAGWAYTNIAAIRGLKSSTNFRFVLLCHDLIPLFFPHFYSKHDVELFRTYMLAALETANLIVVASRKVREDCRIYATKYDIGIGTIVLAPLGFDVDGLDSNMPSLPDGLMPGRFVLMVSTIEPRKGHRLLYNVWRRLITAGVIQSKEFKLVFVGRRGWMVDDLLQQIRSDEVVSGKIVIMNNVNDDLLKALYEQAAFCVYPSHYEGYGLPICEAFSHGKAVLASTGGALPELTQGLSPCLDPKDEEAWYRSIKEWIENPDVKVPFEQAIKNQFSHPTWSEAAEKFFCSL